MLMLVFSIVALDHWICRDGIQLIYSFWMVSFQDHAILWFALHEIWMRLHSSFRSRAFLYNCSNTSRACIHHGRSKSVEWMMTVLQVFPREMKWLFLSHEVRRGMGSHHFAQIVSNLVPYDALWVVEWDESKPLPVDAKSELATRTWCRKHSARQNFLSGWLFFT